MNFSNKYTYKDELHIFYCLLQVNIAWNYSSSPASNKTVTLVSVTTVVWPPAGQPGSVLTRTHTRPRHSVAARGPLVKLRQAAPGLQAQVCAAHNQSGHTLL